METISAPPRRKPSQDENQDRRVVYTFRNPQRDHREYDVGLHTFRGRRYWEIATFDLLPGGARDLTHRTSFALPTFRGFRAAFDALEAAIREEGEL